MEMHQILLVSKSFFRVFCSLTITEKGYCQNVHGRLNVDNTFIKSDIALLRCKVSVL